MAALAPGSPAASPSRTPTRAAQPDATTAPSPVSPLWRLASAPAAVDASPESSPASAHSGELADTSSSLLASRSEEYRLLFRLPPDEILMQDFNCALQENILLQGHMYLFQHHICFYSNIFGYETKKTIPLQDVTDIRKAKTAAIFPNAIEIVAGTKRHFFGSFLSRDEAYRIIVDGWEQHVSDARLLVERQDGQDTKSGSSSDENGYVLLEGAKEPKQDDDSSPLDRSVDGTVLANGSNDIGDSDINISKRFSKVEENKTEDNCTTLNPFISGLFDDDAPNVPEPYTLIVESKFQVPVEALYNVLLSDGAFGFLDDFHKKCADKEFSCSQWRLDEQGGFVRDVSFLHPIKIYLGAKFGTCQEVQKLRVYKNRHIVIQTSQQIGDAPYGDHFTVEGIWDVKQDGLDGSSCYLRIYINVAFSKKTIFRGKIDQSTKDECREVFGLLVKLAHDILKEEESGSQSKGATSSTIADVPSVATSSENPLENTGPGLPAAPDEPGVGSHIPSHDHLRSLGRDSIPSTSQEPCVSFTSYMRSSQLGPLLAVALVAIIVLMQVTIIVLLIRSPKVVMVSHENSPSSLGFSKESMEWAQKRLSLLGEEMRMAEGHMERMRYEFAWLKSHLERLDSSRSSS